MKWEYNFLWVWTLPRVKKDFPFTRQVQKRTQTSRFSIGVWGKDQAKRFPALPYEAQKLWGKADSSGILVLRLDPSPQKEMPSSRSLMSSQKKSFRSFDNFNEINYIV
jgi:hypothetical protein